ncbi:MAG: helix-turn-helix domain-containing protein [Ktedonobacteraceae bacterium]
MAERDKRGSAVREEPSKRVERAERILSAAAELIQRWGYRKTTIDDIAKQAGVAKGTIYLHWKTRDDLFHALLMRERLVMAKEVEQRIASDPEGATLHGMTKHITLATMHNPLIKALVIRDTDVLGDLAHSEFGKTDFEQRIESGKAYLEQLRSSGLTRTDIDVRTQIQMVSAISTGFFMINQFLPEAYHLTDEETAEMVAETIRRTFELRNPTASEYQEAVTRFNSALERTLERSRKELQS